MSISHVVADDLTLEELYRATEVAERRLQRKVNPTGVGEIGRGPPSRRGERCTFAGEPVRPRL
jgi:hypothetical protein